MPMMMARTGQNSDAPALMLIRPTASVAICAFSMNHHGPRCQTVPFVQRHLFGRVALQAARPRLGRCHPQTPT
jgi:hypothetical protein